MGDQAFLWEPAKYAQFSDYRDRPFFDLTSRITAKAPSRVVDLGCGPGNLTATLAARWPGASVLGLDSSTAMIAAAQAAHSSGVDAVQEADTVQEVQPQMLNSDGGAPASPAVRRTPGLGFGIADIAGWTPDGSTDVVVSNAALQWVPGHRELMSGWLAALRPGAWLGVQVPGNFGSPSHVIMRELAASPRWRDRLDGVLRHDDAVAEPDEYQELFLRAGARVEVWETTYNQLLQGPDPVLDWVRGTGLRPVLAALGPDESVDFETEYAALLAAAYPAGEFGTIYPFRRIFMVGEKQ